MIVTWALFHSLLCQPPAAVAPRHCPRRLWALAFCSELCVSGPWLPPAPGHGDSSSAKVCMCAREKVWEAETGARGCTCLWWPLSVRGPETNLVALSSQGFPPSLIRLLLGSLNMSYSNIKTPEFVLFYNIFTCVC